MFPPTSPSPAEPRPTSFIFTAESDNENDDGESEAAFRLPRTTLPPGVTEGTPAQAPVTITDDDTAGVSVSTTTLAVLEGESVSYTVVLTSEPSATTTIAISGHAGTDISLGGESLSASNILTFATSSWSTAQAVTVSAAEDDDSTADADVTLTHTVAGGDYEEVTAGDVVVTITENDSPTLAVSDAQASESDGTVDFEVTLSTTTSNVVTVAYATSNGTATAGSDYTTATGTLNFAAGSTASQTISVPVLDDADDEVETETFTLTLSGATNAVLSGGGQTLEATGRITDDDDPSVTVSFDQGTYSVTEGSDVTVTVTLNEPPGRSVTVSIDTTEENGATTADYRGVPSSVRFGASETQKSFTFTAADDSDDDDGESVGLTFGSLPSGVVAGAITAATVSISDNDRPADPDSPIGVPMLTLSVTPGVIEEQGGSRASTATVTASLDKTSAAETTVTISTDPAAAAWFALSTNKELNIQAGDSASTGLVTVTAMNGEDFGDYRVLTVEGIARNSTGADGPDPVTLTILGKDAFVTSYPENGTGPVMTFTSTDPENGQPGEGIDWDVTGVDADDFFIDTRGMLMFRRPPDYEDSNGQTARCCRNEW